MTPDPWASMGPEKTESARRRYLFTADADSDVNPAHRAIYVDKACTLRLTLLDNGVADIDSWVFPQAGIYAIRIRRLVENADNALVLGLE